MFPTCTRVHMKRAKSSRRWRGSWSGSTRSSSSLPAISRTAGAREQLERAAELLRSLGPPVLAVPGNHDLPYTPARFVRPWTAFERVWETTEPTASAPRPARRRAQLGPAVPPPGRRVEPGAARARGGAARRGRRAGALRVAVLHHHLIGAPWRAARKRPSRAATTCCVRCWTQAPISSSRATSTRRRSASGTTSRSSATRRTRPWSPDRARAWPATAAAAGRGARAPSSTRRTPRRSSSARSAGRAATGR